MQGIIQFKHLKLKFSEFQTTHFKLGKLSSSTRECPKSSADT